MPKVRLILLTLSLFLLIRLYLLIPAYLGPEGLRDRLPPVRLIQVETGEQFDAILKKKRAAIFLSARTSVYSKQSELVVEQWLRTSRPGFPVYFVEVEHSFLLAWLNEHDREDLTYRGRGEVLWLRHGVVVTEADDPGRGGESALQETTHEAFGSSAR